MNQLAENAFVCAETIHLIEAVQLQSAERAAARFIERRPIQKRSAAGNAKELCMERFGLTKATGTNGDTRNFVEALTADAAIVGEEKV
jgi:hypothetical protein